MQNHPTSPYFEYRSPRELQQIYRRSNKGFATSALVESRGSGIALESNGELDVL